MAKKKKNIFEGEDLDLTEEDLASVPNRIRVDILGSETKQEKEKKEKKAEELKDAMIGIKKQLTGIGKSLSVLITINQTMLASLSHLQAVTAEATSQHKNIDFAGLMPAKTNSMEETPSEKNVYKTVKLQTEFMESMTNMFQGISSAIDTIKGGVSRFFNSEEFSDFSVISSALGNLKDSISNVYRGTTDVFKTLKSTFLDNPLKGLENLFIRDAKVSEERFEDSMAVAHEQTTLLERILGSLSSNRHTQNSMAPFGKLKKGTQAAKSAGGLLDKFTNLAALVGAGGILSRVGAILSRVGVIFMSSVKFLPVIGWVVTALVGIFGGLVNVIKKYGSGETDMGKLLESFMAGLLSTLTLGLVSTEFFEKTLAGFGQSVMGIIKDLKNIVMDLWDSLSGSLLSLMKAGLTLFKLAASLITLVLMTLKFITKFISPILSLAGILLNGIAFALRVATWSVEKVVSLITKVMDILTYPFEMIIKFVDHFVGLLDSTITEVFTALSDFVRGIPIIGGEIADAISPNKKSAAPSPRSFRPTHMPIRRGRISEGASMMVDAAMFSGVNVSSPNSAPIVAASRPRDNRAIADLVSLTSPTSTTQPSILEAFLGKDSIIVGLLTTIANTITTPQIAGVASAGVSIPSSRMSQAASSLSEVNRPSVGDSSRSGGSVVTTTMQVNAQSYTTITSKPMVRNADPSTARSGVQFVGQTYSAPRRP